LLSKRENRDQATLSDLPIIIQQSEGIGRKGNRGIESGSGLDVCFPCSTHVSLVFPAPGSSFMKYRPGPNDLETAFQLKPLKTLPLKMCPWPSIMGTAYNLLEIWHLDPHPEVPKDSSFSFTISSGDSYTYFTFTNIVPEYFIPSLQRIPNSKLRIIK
jgi:hypothetical protein